MPGPYPVQGVVGEMPVARPAVGAAQRRAADAVVVSLEILGVKPGNRMPEAIRSPRIQVSAPVADLSKLPLSTIRMIAPEEQPFRNLIKRAIEGELGDRRPVRAVIASGRWHATQDRRPGNTPVIIAASDEQGATEALGRMRGGGGQRVLLYLDHRARPVNA